MGQILVTADTNAAVDNLLEVLPSVHFLPASLPPCSLLIPTVYLSLHHYQFGSIIVTL